MPGRGKERERSDSDLQRSPRSNQKRPRPNIVRSIDGTSFQVTREEQRAPNAPPAAGTSGSGRGRNEAVDSARASDSTSAPHDKSNAGPSGYNSRKKLPQPAQSNKGSQNTGTASGRPSSSDGPRSSDSAPSGKPTQSSEKRKPSPAKSYHTPSPPSESGRVSPMAPMTWKDEIRSSSPPSSLSETEDKPRKPRRFRDHEGYGGQPRWYG
ncbi:MAG: hypothetical protein M1828_006005 [Chrysothrix sp. TS-e1954]|nr:MAG: hypothetical protein M1828_006005 [Chrysothrix sp. TS-e1954]